MLFRSLVDAEQKTVDGLKTKLTAAKDKRAAERTINSLNKQIEEREVQLEKKKARYDDQEKDLVRRKAELGALAGVDRTVMKTAQEEESDRRAEEQRLRKEAGEGALMPMKQKRAKGATTVTLRGRKRVQQQYEAAQADVELAEETAQRLLEAKLLEASEKEYAQYIKQAASALQVDISKLSTDEAELAVLQAFDALNQAPPKAPQLSVKEAAAKITALREAEATHQTDLLYKALLDVAKNDIAEAPAPKISQTERNELLIEAGFTQADGRLHTVKPHPNAPRDVPENWHIREFVGAGLNKPRIVVSASPAHLKETEVAAKDAASE